MLPAALPAFRPFLLTLALAFSPVLLAQTSDASKGASTELQLSADGSEVQDLRARLVWPRCVHGMVWRNERCQGTPQRLNYSQAQKLAQSLHREDGLGWRLPRTNELRRLQQRTAAPTEQAAALFAQTPGDWHWTGTAAINSRAINRYSYEATTPARNSLPAPQAWAVDWATGQASGEMGRGNVLLVRLVRPLPATELPPATP